MGFSRQGCCSGLLCPPPEDLPDPGVEPRLRSPVLAGGFFTTSATWEALFILGNPPKLRTVGSGQGNFFAGSQVCLKFFSLSLERPWASDLKEPISFESQAPQLAQEA